MKKVFDKSLNGLRLAVRIIANKTEWEHIQLNVSVAEYERTMAQSR